MKQKIVPCLWFDSGAEEAAQFYTSFFPDSKIIQTEKYNVETPSNKSIGSVMTVEFEILGYKFLGLNGGHYFKPFALTLPHWLLMRQHTLLPFHSWKTANFKY